VTPPATYLCLRIGGQEFLLPSADVRAVISTYDVSPSAHRLPCVVGSVCVGGWSLPVVDLREKLGAQAGARGRSPVIVVTQLHREEGPRWLGILAAHVGNVLTLRPAEFRNGAARISGRMKRLLDPDQLFSAEELRALMLGSEGAKGRPQELPAN